MQFQHTQRFSTAHEFADYVIAAIDWLWHEGAEHPKMLSIGLHLRMLGRPAAHRRPAAHSGTYPEQGADLGSPDAMRSQSIGRLSAAE